jgi:plastocyanin
MSSRRPPRLLLSAVVVAVLAFGGTACGGGANGSSSASPGTVTVQDNVFRPRTVKIKAGETVRWEFKGSVAHNVQGEGFASDTMKTGTFEHAFPNPGKYDYICTIHAGMKGTVEVS